MKKLNQNGFAISTILYGLLVVLILIISLIVGSMAFTRKNSKEFAEVTINQLEEEKRNKYNDNDKTYCKTIAYNYALKYQDLLTEEQEVNQICTNIENTLKNDYLHQCIKEKSSEASDECKNQISGQLTKIQEISTNCRVNIKKETDDSSRKSQLQNSKRTACCYSRNMGENENYNSCMS